MRRRPLSPWSFAALLVIAAACGTNANGQDICRQILDAQCRRGPACGISLEPPHASGGATDVDACIRYYDVACLHGLEVGNPSSVQLSACLGAINGSCTAAASPQNDPACSWLSPPPAAAAADASDDVVEAAAADAASE